MESADTFNDFLKHLVTHDNVLRCFKMKYTDPSAWTKMETALHIAKQNNPFIWMEIETPLNRAAQNGLLDIVKQLIEEGADVNEESVLRAVNRGAQTGEFLLSTPLIVAAGDGHLEVVKYLIEKGANIEYVDDTGRSPLFMATIDGHLEVIKFLIDKGANINVKTIKGSTPLRLAKDLNHWEVIKLLKANGASDDDNGGCYIATCVYGSYDCPEVWTLRRFRDNILLDSWFGRQFIRIYYATSPNIVKLFGKEKWFNRLWKSILDRLICKLQNHGIESSSYSDKRQDTREAVRAR